jgi:hypothetical protein
MERREAIERALSELPLMLTVEQTCTVLGIGRSLGYAEVRRYLATGGREGIPAVRIGSVLRIPRTALVELLATVTVPSGDNTTGLSAVVETSSAVASAQRSARTRRRTSSATVAQLPFAASD